MKFQLTFKTPDVLDQIDGPGKSSVCIKTAKKFIEYDEYINIEFDTDTGTAVVLKK